MTKDVQDAIEILTASWVEVEKYKHLDPFASLLAKGTLYRAIRHLAYSDRDTYPKTRKGTKGAPIVRRQRTVDDIR